VLDEYGDEAVVEQHVEEPGDDPPVPGHAGLDGVVDDGHHAGVATLPIVEVVRQLAPAARGRRQQDDDGGEKRGSAAAQLHLSRRSASYGPLWYAVALAAL
jgi:hypothetical protein